MSRRGHALVLLALAFPIATAACSSGSDSTATTTVTGTVAPTTEPTTTEATTTSSTTEAPTTSIDPAEAFAAEVEADFLETFQLTDEAIQDPTNDAKVAAALEGYIEGNLIVITTQLEELRQNNWVARQNPDIPAGVTIETRARPNGTESDEAVLQACEVSSWIVVEPGAGQDGSDLIVDPDVSSYRSLYVLRLVDGRWRIVGSESLGTWAGVAGCEDA